MPYVELHHFRAFHPAGIGQGKGQGGLLPGTDRQRVGCGGRGGRGFRDPGEGRLPVGEGRITQAEAEGIQRSGRPDGELAGILHRPIIIDGRDLTHIAREGDRQFAGGIDQAEEDLGDRLTGCHAAFPGVQDGVHVVLRPADG